MAQVISKKIKPYKPYFTPFPDIGDKLSRILFLKNISQFRARPPARGGLDQDQGRLCHTGLWNKYAKKNRVCHAFPQKRNSFGTFFFLPPSANVCHSRKKGGKSQDGDFLSFATSFASLLIFPPFFLSFPRFSKRLLMLAIYFGHRHFFAHIRRKKTLHFPILSLLVFHVGITVNKVRVHAFKINFERCTVQLFYGKIKAKSNFPPSISFPGFVRRKWRHLRQPPPLRSQVGALDFFHWKYNKNGNLLYLLHRQDTD